MYMFMAESNLREMIWQIVAAIPKGRVTSYGQVARIAGYPGHARYVGATLKSLPKNSTLPWYRVVNARGRISFPQGSESYKRQRDRLESEGIVFLNDKISMRKFGWK